MLYAYLGIFLGFSPDGPALVRPLYSGEVHALCADDSREIPPDTPPHCHVMLEPGADGPRLRRLLPMEREAAYA